MDDISKIVSPRLQQLQTNILNAGPNALQQFWIEIQRQGSPLIESSDTEGYSLVTFVWRDDGVARNVAVIQDFGTDGIREQHMARLPNSDVWYLTRLMRSDTRTTYQLSPSPSPDPGEPAPYRLDPLNPKTFPGFFNETGNHILFSLLELPNVPSRPWREANLAKKGVVQLHTPFSDGRRLWVYLPPDRTTEQLPLLTVFDGRLYKDLQKLPDILDYLISQKKIMPTAVLMVDNQDRSELQCSPDFADYIAQQVIPWIRSTYPIVSEPSHTIAMGSSLGGLAATFLAVKHPDVFGKVFAQTGWFRWRPENDPELCWLPRQLAELPTLPVQFWLQVGNLEVAQMLDDGPSQLAANQRMRDTLQSKGYSVSYYEYSGGHDASSLESPLAKGLMEILQL